MLTLKRLFKDWKQANKEKEYKELAKINKELTEYYASITDLSEEEVLKLGERIFNNKKFREKIVDELKKEVDNGLAKRALLASGLGAMGIGSILSLLGSKADALKVKFYQDKMSFDDEFYLPIVLPFSAMAYIDKSRVNAINWKGKLIAKGEAGIEDASVINQAALEVKNAGGGVLKIKSRTYKISEPIQLLTGVDYIGEGAGKTVFSAVTDDINILEGVEKLVNQTFKGFSLLASTAKATAIDLKKGASRCTFIDIQGYFAYPGHPLTGYYGLVLRGVDPDTGEANNNQYSNVFINCRFEYFDINIYLYGQNITNARCNANKFFGGVVGRGNKNIYINGQGNVFVGIVLNPTQTGKYYVYAEGDITIENVFLGCYFEIEDSNNPNLAEMIYMDTPTTLARPAVMPIDCIGVYASRIKDVNDPDRVRLISSSYVYTRELYAEELVSAKRAKFEHSEDKDGIIMNFSPGTPSANRALFAVGDPTKSPNYPIYWERDTNGNDNLYLGASWCPIVLRGNIEPITDGDYSIGSASKMLKEIYSKSMINAEVYRDDYGGNFANFTPPTPKAPGHFFFAEDTNSSNPAKRLYVSLDGSTWSYVDLT